MKQQKWSGGKINSDELKEIKREERIEVEASILIIVLAIFVGMLAVGFLLELLQ